MLPFHVLIIDQVTAGIGATTRRIVDTRLGSGETLGVYSKADTRRLSIRHLTIDRR